MKKWLSLFIFAAILVGCNNETANNTQEVSGNKLETTTTKEKNVSSEDSSADVLTLEDAIQINNNIEMAFGYIWGNVENLGLGGDDFTFTPADDYAPVIERFKAIATDNYLDDAYIQNLRSKCYACDADTLGYSLSNSDNFKLTQLDHQTFSLFAHRPADWYYGEMNITKTFKLIDGHWKIDDEAIEVLSEEPFSMDTFVETTDHIPNEQFQSLYDDTLQIFVEHMHYNQSTLDSTIDVYAHKFELIEAAKASIKQLEELAKTKDPYFDIHTSVFNSVLADTVAYAEEDSQGGSMQGAFMLDAEASMLEQRLHSIYYNYKEHF